MKAEDSLTIDLTGKSSIADFMVVASGRSQRHVASIADQVVKDIEKAGVPRGPTARRLGADRCRRCDRARVPAGSTGPLQSGKDVVGWQTLVRARMIFSENRYPLFGIMRGAKLIHSWARCASSLPPLDA
jgi:hypothetical protein